MTKHPAEVDLSRLQKEQDELHSYARHNFQLLISWFSFFSTTNLVAMGWIISESMKHELTRLPPMVIIGLFFIFQNALAVVGCDFVSEMYANQQIRLGDILHVMNMHIADDSQRAKTLDMVFSTYRRLVKLINQAIKSMLVFWVLLLAVIFLSTRDYAIFGLSRVMAALGLNDSENVSPSSPATPTCTCIVQPQHK